MRRRTHVVRTRKRISWGRRSTSSSWTVRSAPRVWKIQNSKVNGRAVLPVRQSSAKHATVPAAPATQPRGIVEKPGRLRRDGANGEGGEEGSREERGRGKMEEGGPGAAQSSWLSSSSSSSPSALSPLAPECLRMIGSQMAWTSSFWAVISSTSAAG